VCRRSLGSQEANFEDISSYRIRKVGSVQAAVLPVIVCCANIAYLALHSVKLHPSKDSLTGQAWPPISVYFNTSGDWGMVLVFVSPL